MKKVAILMSTYNGNSYIQQQIDSIYAQDYTNFCLYVRDDGSDPAFVKQLESYQKKYGFVLYKGENIGFLESFFWLLDKVADADYYAFSDQDDIWHTQKLSRAVAWLDEQEKKEKQIPLLYHCAYEVRDEHNTLVEQFYFPEETYDFRRSLTENHYSGFAMVVNQKMREYMMKAEVKQLDYHDWWAANIAKGIGISYFDTYVGAIHRAHQKNVTKITFSKKIEWLLASIKQESAIHKRAKECERVFYHELSLEEQRILKMFTRTHYYLPDALKKCCYPKRWRPILSSEIVMRILMLLGKV